MGITGILAELDEKYWNTVLTTLTMDSWFEDDQWGMLDWQKSLQEIHLQADQISTQVREICEDYILSSLVLNTHYVMFPRHETALIHYTGRAVINLGLDFTSRDSVDSYGPRGYATCPVRLFFQWHDVLAFS